MQKLRTRLVNFRVSDEEFRQLKQACKKQGSRCLSEFARAVMLAPAGSISDMVLATVDTLDRRVMALEVSVVQLTEIIARAVDVEALRPGGVEPEFRDLTSLEKP